MSAIDWFRFSSSSVVDFIFIIPSGFIFCQLSFPVICYRCQHDAVTLNVIIPAIPHTIRPPKWFPVEWLPELVAATGVFDWLVSTVRPRQNVRRSSYRIYFCNDDQIKHNIYGSTCNY